MVSLVRGTVVASPSSFNVLPGTENRIDRQKETQTGGISGCSTLTAHLKITVQKDCGLVLLLVWFSFSPWKWRVPVGLMISKVSTSREGLIACYRCSSPAFPIIITLLGSCRWGTQALLSVWGALWQAQLEPSCSSPASTPLHGKG